MTQLSNREAHIHHSFNKAAESYESAAFFQRHTAKKLLAHLRQKLGDRQPRRILEVGCGTGFLTQLLREEWPEADILATDIAPHMLEQAQKRAGSGVSFRIMDVAQPDVTGPFDMVCGNLVFQWLAHPQDVLNRLNSILQPGGIVGFSTLLDGTFSEWQEACAPDQAGTPVYPSADAVQRLRPALCSGVWVTETCVQPFQNAAAFLHHLRQTGAQVPRVGHKTMSISRLKRAMARFDAAGQGISWQVAYGCFQKPTRAGVFVTGTDTGVGKTFVSACLVKAWKALYWKPLQSGLTDEQGDTPTIENLTGCGPDACFPPAGAFQASLSPEAAAHAEGVSIDPASLALPLRDAERPLVVEGAGGLMVPATDTLMMLDLAQKWGLPVVLVARSGLGTLNHTLLSLDALRQKGVAIAGVVMNGPLNPANSQTIAQKGRVRILAEIPHQAEVSAQAVSQVAATLPLWADISAE